jgi:hypothetical protein
MERGGVYTSQAVPRCVAGNYMHTGNMNIRLSSGCSGRIPRSPTTTLRVTGSATTVEVIQKSRISTFTYHRPSRRSARTTSGPGEGGIPRFPVACRRQVWRYYTRLTAWSLPCSRASIGYAHISGLWSVTVRDPPVTRHLCRMENILSVYPCDTYSPLVALHNCAFFTT